MRAKVFLFAFAAAVFSSGCFYITTPDSQPADPEDKEGVIVLDPDKEKYPLMAAADKCDMDELKNLLKISAFRTAINEPDELGAVALMYAASKGCGAAVALLLENGADPNVKEQSKGWTALIWAASDGKDNVVEALLKAEDIKVDERDSKGRTALSHAAKKGNEGAIDLLLGAGADPNASDSRGRSPLMYAARMGRDGSVAKLLAAANIQVDAQSARGRTALIEAARKGHDKIMGRLLAAGADPNLKDFNERNPLMHASMRGKVNIVKELLKINEVLEKINEQDKDKKTAFLLAEEEGYQQVAELLRGAGADTDLGKGAFLNIRRALKKIFFLEIDYEGKDQARATAAKPDSKKSFFEKIGDFFKNLF